MLKPYKSLNSVFKNLENFFKKLTTREPVVETTVTLRTKYLATELERFYNLNVLLSVLALISALSTGIATLNEHIVRFPNDQTIASNSDILVLNNETVAYKGTDILLIILAVVTIFLSVAAVFSICKTSNPNRFLNSIIRDQYDVEEFTAIFIIKMVFNNVPKILVFRSDIWNSYFLPYCHYDEKDIQDDEDRINNEFKDKLKTPLSEVLEISPKDFEIFDDFSKNKYIVIKKNPSHEGKSKINYKFFYVKFTNPIITQKFLTSQSTYFSWKSKAELASDVDTQIRNGDVIQIIDELSLINQSQLAFKEKRPAIFDIPSRYRIIWNITSECGFNCPICATNSGSTQHFKCKTTAEEKLKILINLASINGFIDHLDISGGDPLINEEDKMIIKKAHQLFPYSDVSVTTTGKALEKLGVDELVQTVKTCDITYDIPYNICSEDLSRYREYQYNYSNFKQLERFSNSGIKIALNIHIPILPITTDKELVATILEDLSKINPAQIKFIRLMPVGRMVNFPEKYDPGAFLKFVHDIMKEKNYKFKLAYNCSLGVRVYNESNTDTCRKCEMLTHKLGIDSLGNVYSCIWGAYIPEFKDKPAEENPFYLGDLKKDTLYDILTSPNAIKLSKRLSNKKEGCRVCAYVSHSQNLAPIERMLQAEDPMSMVNTLLSIESE